MKFTPVLLLAVTAIFALQACKKDKHPGQDQPTEQQLQVNFPAGTIAYATVDSASIVLTKQGSNTPIYRRFNETTNNLRLELDNSQAGNWTAEITIYTKKAGDNSSRMYTRSVGFSLPLASDLNLVAPTGSIADNWKPHIVLSADNSEVVAVIAADNAEPYFDIRVKDSKWDYFYIERYAHNRVGGTNEQVAADSWECFNGCYTHDKLIVNTTAFANFSNTVRTKTWNNGEIYIIVVDAETQQEHTFFYVYDK